MDLCDIPSLGSPFFFHIAITLIYLLGNSYCYNSCLGVRLHQQYRSILRACIIQISCGPYTCLAFFFCFFLLIFLLLLLNAFDNVEDQSKRGS
jgi:hypothetical protein